jgi:hypothetical protein
MSIDQLRRERELRGPDQPLRRAQLNVSAFDLPHLLPYTSMHGCAAA